ncbi:tachykinin-like peptides receptor 99D isoform X1 [Plutella xylostella]|uniref:tachykinin-like peptides receptor 99D isoform X1 n=1 Tax=Plutella xylostella TaxID=51655 RepID=UPI002032ADB1|nr:tachykinin-like peptides receptor 99D isoform X1 [Plutella xylostella]XP_048478821.1 tachykinin-like peptides receptor 99D isoform X1 [Plutella xylostella]
MLNELFLASGSNESSSFTTEPYSNHVTYYGDFEHSFNNSGNETEVYQSFILPWWRQLLWTALFGGMVVVATVGNLVVVWIVLANKRMRSVTNYFLVNLSVADTMVSTLNVTFNYTYMLYSDWPFGHFYCKFCQFVAVLSISASVFTLMAISIDRYVAIISPLRPRLGKRATLAIAAAIWAGSCVISSPNLIYFTTADVETLPDGSSRRVCFSEWPDGITTMSRLEYIYNIAFMVLTYFLPIISMTYTYARVGVELWGSQSIGECTQRQLDNVKSKRRVVKMMMVVVVIFAVCWLPFHVYFLVTSYYPDVVNYEHIQEIYLGIYWLAMSNSMYNPIIYCWMNSKFRRGFKQFFWCCGALDRGGLSRHRAFGPERSGRSLSPSRKNGSVKRPSKTTQLSNKAPGTIRMSLHSTYNNTLLSSA